MREPVGSGNGLDVVRTGNRDIRKRSQVRLELIHVHHDSYREVVSDVSSFRGVTERGSQMTE